MVSRCKRCGSSYRVVETKWGLRRRCYCVKKDRKSTIALFGIMGILIIGVIGGAITSEEVDELCQDTNSLLYRTSSSWVCVNATPFNQTGGAEVGGGNYSFNVSDGSSTYLMADGSILTLLAGNDITIHQSNGTFRINYSGTGGGGANVSNISLGDLNDVDTSSANSGDVITWDGVEWYTVPLSSGDEVWKNPVISMDLNSPPASPSVGDRYIVASDVEWWDLNYARRQKVTINSSMVEESEELFTLTLIIPEDNELFNYSLPSGIDIKFVEEDHSTLMNMVVEDWNQSGRKAVFRTQITELSDVTDTEFYIYYNYSGLTTFPVDNPYTYRPEYGIFYEIDETGQDGTSNYRHRYSEMGSLTHNKSFVGLNDIGDGNDAWNMKDVSYWEQGWFIRTHNAIVRTGSDITTAQVILSEGGGTNGVTMYIYDNKIYGRWWSESDGWAGDHQVSDTLAEGLTSDGNISADTVYYITMAYNYNGGGATNAYELFVNGVQQDTGGTTVTDMNAHSGDGGIMYTGTNSKDFHSFKGAGFYWKGALTQLEVLDEQWTLEKHQTWYNEHSNNEQFINISIGQQQGGGALGDWTGHDKAIAEWDGLVWTFDEPPTDGWTLWVTDRNQHYTFNEVKDNWFPWSGLGSHSSLTDLQGGQSEPEMQHYHLTELEYNATTRTATQSLSGLMPSGYFDNWNNAYKFRLEAVSSDYGTLISENAVFTVTGGEGVNTNASASTLQINVDDANTTSKGIAMFNPSDFEVGNGMVNLSQLIIETVLTPNGTLTINSNVLNISADNGILVSIVDNVLKISSNISSEAVEINWSNVNISGSDAVTYNIKLVSATDNVYMMREFVNETILLFSNQPEVPRNLQYYLANFDMSNDMNGTLVINGLNADGKLINETIEVNVGPMGASVSDSTSQAFATVSSVVTTSTGASTMGFSSLGLGERIGVGNYPFNANTDVFKVSKNRVHLSTTSYSVAKDYGTVFITSTSLQENDTITVWYRPYK